LRLRALSAVGLGLALDASDIIFARVCSEEFWNALVNAIKETNPTYAAAVAGMQARDGMVPTRIFAIVSGAPVRQARQVVSDVVLERLSAIRLLDHPAP